MYGKVLIDEKGISWYFTLSPTYQTVNAKIKRLNVSLVLWFYFELPTVPASNTLTK